VGAAHDAAGAAAAQRPRRPRAAAAHPVSAAGAVGALLARRRCGGHGVSSRGSGAVCVRVCRVPACGRTALGRCGGAAVLPVLAGAVDDHYDVPCTHIIHTATGLTVL
jgi:hypothetical protein